MKVAVGADHGGWSLKEHLKPFLDRLGHEVVDVGTFSAESVDYPDYGRSVADRVAGGEVERGIAVCTTGIGMSIVTNKVAGVRSALCHDARSAKFSRAHNDANVLALGGAVVTPEQAEEIVRIWLETPFEGVERHVRRVGKIDKLDGRG